MRARVSAIPGPSSASSTGSTRSRTRTRVKPGSRLCGSSQNVQPLDPAGRHGVDPAYAEQRAREDAEGRAHPLQRPPSRAAGQAEEDGLGLVVQRVPEQHDADRQAGGDLLQDGVPRLAGRGLRSQSRGRVDPDAGGDGLVDAQRRELGDHPVRLVGRRRAAGRGRRSRRRPAGPACGPRTRRPRPAPASRPRRCTRRRRRRPRRGPDSAARTGSRTAATAGWSVTARGRPTRRGR